MLEIEQLEKEWRIYKLKRFRPLILTLSIVAVTGTGIYLWSISDWKIDGKTLKRSVFGTEKEEKAVRKSAPPATAPERNVSSPETIVKNVEKIEPLQRKETVTRVEKPSEPKPMATEKKPEVEEKSVVLNPDTEFLNNLQTEKETVSETAEHRKTKEEPVKEEVIAVTKELPEKEKPTERTAPVQEKPVKLPVKTGDTTVAIEKKEENGSSTSSLLIQTKQTNNTLEYLIERFNQNRDPKLAAYIAQSFYKKGLYKETVKWSIVANSLEPSSEESWILFAKAKVKLGQREDAIQALRIFLNQYSSRKVKSYLESLESGL
ncbi:CDC27 family protein [Hydrogenimonas sp.]